MHAHAFKMGTYLRKEYQTYLYIYIYFICSFIIILEIITNCYISSYFVIYDIFNNTCGS